MSPFRLPENDRPRTPEHRPRWVAKQVDRTLKGLSDQARSDRQENLAHSPFDFFRCTNRLFWADLADSPLLEAYGGGKGTLTRLCGDAHWANFGCLTDPSGRLLYDLVDLDGTVVGDFQMDLWRLTVSLVLSGEEGRQGPKAVRGWVEAVCWGYWRELKACRWNPRHCFEPWDTWQASGSLRRFLDRSAKSLGYAMMMEEWTRSDKGRRLLKVGKNPKLKHISSGTQKRLKASLEKYASQLRPWPGEKPRTFKVLDLARRVHKGAASEGSRRYYALVQVEEKGTVPWRILDLKAQGKTSFWKYLPKKAKKRTKQGGNLGEERVVQGHRELSHSPDPWLGTLRMKDEGFTVQQRSPFRSRMDLEDLNEEAAYQLGGILARAHCRGREKFTQKAFESMRGRKGKFRALVQSLSFAYADQVREDHRTFLGSHPA